ncbi:MAG: tetratricopeptide repeat protein [Planctomycetes bacterium]|nr:tetratricopeptide repeat protein [Planctomycetota bacterium]
MPRRYFNWKLAIVLIISICVLGVTAFGLRQWQRTHRADQGLILGNEAYDEQKWDEAAKNLGRYISVEPFDIPILMKYAEAQLKIRPSKRGNIAYALTAYRSVLRADKSNYKAAMELTEIYLLWDQSHEAELIASKYLDNNDDPEPEIREMLARALEKQLKFTEAEAELKAIIQEHPDQISAYEMLGKLAEGQDDIMDPNDPVHWFNEAVDKNQDSALAYIARAGFYQSKDRDKALTNLGTAEEKDLSDPDVKLRLAGEFVKANILVKAEKYLTSVQMSIPTDLRVWEIWAELAMKLNSKEKMQKVADTGLKELSSQSLDFMPIATELFIWSGQLDRAAVCISEMKQKDVSPMAVAFLEGLKANVDGDLSEAIRCWEKSIGLVSTTHPTIRSALLPKIRLELSSAFARIGDTQSAIKHLDTLISENPDYITGHLKLAKLFAYTRNWEQSARYAAIAKQLSPENSEAILLDLQAKIHLQASNSAGENIQTFKVIEKKLSELDEAVNNLPVVKFLKFQIALQQSNFIDAQKLVTQLKKDYPSLIETALAEAELLVAQDKTDEAISILKDALEKFPQAIKPVEYLADLYERKGDKEQCESIINEAMDHIDHPINRRELGLRLANYYVRWNQSDKVYSHLNTLVQELPEDILLKRGLLDCEQIRNDSVKAQQLVDEIKLIEGDKGWQWRYEQARIWFTPEDFGARYSQILELLLYNIKANPNDQASRMLLAEAYKGSDELQLAISTYRDALSRSPDNLSIIIPLIEVLSSSMEFDEVDRLLKRAGNSQQDIFKTQLQEFHLQSHKRHGQLSSASVILEEFIRSDPNDQTKRFSLAVLKIKQGKYDEAKGLLDELKAQSPDSLQFTYTLIQLSILQDKPNEALRLCDEMVNKLNDASAYIFRARTKVALMQIDKAIEDFEYAAVIDPNNVNVWMAKSEFYRSINRPNKAIKDILRARSLASSDIRVQKQAVSLLLESDDEDKVLGETILAEALESNPDDVYLRLYHANFLLTKKTTAATEEAVKILQKITEDQPEISRAWVLLGKILLGKGQAEKAMETAFRGLSHAPNDKMLLWLKAGAEAVRSPVLAIPTLKALLEADPNYTDATLLLGRIYIAVGEPEIAVKLLEAKLASCVGIQEERIIKTALAVALHKSGSKTDAQTHFDSLIKSEPDDPTPLKNQVSLLSAERLWDQLYKKVDEWYLNHPKDSRTLISISTGLTLINDSQAIKTAEDILRLVLTKEPENQIVINNLAWVLCKDKDKLQNALLLAQDGLKKYPNYADLLDTRGVINYKLGKFDKAVEDFTKCIELYSTEKPAAVGSHIYLAKSFVKLGQRSKAVEHLKQALDLNQALDPERRTGVITTSDIDEAQQLLKQLQEGN